MVSNIWNKNIPVEKSSYLCDDEITFLNTDKFKHDESKVVLRFGEVGQSVCRGTQKFYHVCESSTSSGVSGLPMSGSFLSSAESRAVSSEVGRL